MAKAKTVKNSTSGAPKRGKSTPQCLVLHHLRDFSGRYLATLTAPYDGTVEDAIRVARLLYQEAFWEYPNASNINSLIGATDGNGRGKWIISSNFKHIAEAGTPEAAYIAGDIHVFERLKQ